MKRLWLAMGGFAVLMILAWTTLDDPRFRFGALAIVAMFAVRTWSHYRKLQQEEQDHRGDSADKP
jgi:membrane protein implicated in regulation of membrane protease activity